MQGSKILCIFLYAKLRFFGGQCEKMRVKGRCPLRGVWGRAALITKIPKKATVRLRYSMPLALTPIGVIDASKACSSEGLFFLQRLSPLHPNKGQRPLTLDVER